MHLAQPSISHKALDRDQPDLKLTGREEALQACPMYDFDHLNPGIGPAPRKDQARPETKPYSEKALQAYPIIPTYALYSPALGKE